ncbi:GIY-YIG nuclease family protein [Roseisolibacter sp. H3M3-2]|uniref:GIY-YIG nuclease family protein n=1 Tax=Roseisolibacter sp. H3M3-2 TaxID=3031323 RepID=UPI0023DC27E5|nr:GIY-YIG nuclease family protein [Roseisolibacter sp. H3M3-2]MDF1502033.1 GIY-YIG nuclease family protein [Roseisolibacter sp. H3M3-2]
MAKTLWVYIMASRTRRLYLGCTSSLPRRVLQHRTAYYRGHTAKYRIERLVWYEAHADARSAVRRERELKGWLRARKVALVESENAGWRDLAPDVGLPSLDLG